MSDGRLRVIRDLGPVKGGKGLKHHEVVLELSVRGLLRYAVSAIRGDQTDDVPQQEPKPQMQTTLSSP